MKTQTVELNFVAQVVLYLVASFIFMNAWNVGLEFLHVPHISYQSSLSCLCLVYLIAKTCAVAISGFMVQMPEPPKEEEETKDNHDDHNNPTPA